MTSISVSSLSSEVAGLYVIGTIAFFTFMAFKHAFVKKSGLTLFRINGGRTR